MSVGFVAVVVSLATAGSVQAQTSMPTISATPEVSPAPTPAPTPYAGYVSLSARGGRAAALREVGNGTLELLIGSEADDLTVAPGVAPMEGSRDDVRRAHVGTDATGRAVVTYPRCKTTTTRRTVTRACDLWVYDVAAGTERLVPGIRRPGRDEYEAVMDRGTVLYSAAATSVTSKTAANNATVGLWIRSAGGRERRIAKNPGRDLALSGDRIAQVITDGVKDAGEEPCANSTLVLRSTRGTARVLGRDCVLSYQQSFSDTWVAPSFVGSRLYWTQRSNGPNLLSYDLRTRQLRQAHVKANVFGFQATGTDAGLAIILADGTTTPEDQSAAANAVAPLAGIRWIPRTKPLRNIDLYVDRDPLA